MLSAPRLRSSQRFRSKDLEETRAGLTELFTSHSLRLIDQKRNLETDVIEAKFRESALVYVSYGAAVNIEADELEHCFLFQRAIGDPIKIGKSSHQGICHGNSQSIISAT